jgi:small subunit ribosomal protein S17
VPATRSPRRTVVGVVVSDKMAKTITVRVERKVRHPKYGKYIVRRETCKAHDENGKAKRGDTVEIAFARRLSKSKFWTLARIVSKARVEAVRGEEEIASVTAPAPAPKAPAAGEEAKS